MVRLNLIIVRVCVCLCTCCVLVVCRAKHKTQKQHSHRRCGLRSTQNICRHHPAQLSTPTTASWNFSTFKQFFVGSTRMSWSRPSWNSGWAFIFFKKKVGVSPGLVAPVAHLLAHACTQVHRLSQPKLAQSAQVRGTDVSKYAWQQRFLLWTRTRDWRI